MKVTKAYPAWVCSDCGLKASKAMGNTTLAFDVSTFHQGTCGVCGEVKSVTEPRDFYYPDFRGIESAKKARKQKENI